MILGDDIVAVMTVEGKISSSELGIISPHEHIYIDIRNQFIEFADISRRVVSEQEVGIHNLDKLSRNPYAVKDNLVLDNEEVVEEELMEFKRAGGDTIVDATLKDIGRDPILLKRISRSLDINVIAGCGYYTQDTHPEKIQKMDRKEIAEEIIKELTIGIDDTDIKAGVIGELGTSEIIYPDEKKVLQAAALAHEKTGAGILVHTFPWGQKGIEAARILLENGVNSRKVCISHIDVELDKTYIETLLEMDVLVEFDNFGKEYYIDKRDRMHAGGVFARDIERVKMIGELINTGYLHNLLISCDICLKTLLHKYGGWGYDHILTHILPMLYEIGLGKKQIKKLIKENPLKFLEMG